jgi:hypothetical protein
MSTKAWFCQAVFSDCVIAAIKAVVKLTRTTLNQNQRNILRKRLRMGSITL